MQKAGLYALLAILGFALVFAFLPSGGVAAQTGATLSGVQLRLYPFSDQDAAWKFAAATVRIDPLENKTYLQGISNGQRLLRERDPGGKLTGRETLDARLATQELTIDGEDNLTTRQARITLVRECADIDLTGTGDQSVKIEQGVGFSAPVAKISSPNTNGRIEKLRMTFGFQILDSDNDRSTITYDIDSTERCVDGKRVQMAVAAPSGT